MEKGYTEPVLEIIEMDGQDIVRTSGDTPDNVVPGQ